MHKTADILVGLINDSSPQVIKKVLQVMIRIYNQFYELLTQSNSNNLEEIEQTWNKFSFIKVRLLRLNIIIS